MFRNDKVTIKRDVYETVKGEAIHKDFLTVAENIPCHLSINLNNTVKVFETPYVMADFTLFLDFNPNLKLQENDILYVETSKNQSYKLFAGEIKAYSLTIQIKCRQEKIIES